MLYHFNSYGKFRNKLTTQTFTKGFENRESVGVQLVLIHKIKWRKPVEHAELTSNSSRQHHTKPTPETTNRSCEGPSQVNQLKQKATEVTWYPHQ